MQRRRLDPKEEAMRFILPCLLLAAFSAWAFQLSDASPRMERHNIAPKDGSTPSAHHYPDFGFMPPARNYEGRVFKLSQDYPPLPEPKRIPAVCTSDFHKVKTEWKQYLLDVRAYCFQENVGNADVEDDWRVEHNKENRWYHMPWQHYGPHGREGIHGLTKEAPVQVRQLAWTQTHAGGQTYAVAFYNEFGGFTIGQVWKDHEHPASGIEKIEFPIGTVVCKVLFVDVPTDQVPFLNPPVQWQGYITDDYQSTKRSIRKLSLIQMDVMVRHKDAPSGWLFGTYQYNGRRKIPEGGSLWHNLVPVGLQWGNDPDIRDDTSNPQPVATTINRKLKESVINPDTDELPPTHLGWNGRLNGPVDNPMSSCMSCHMAAETPQLSQISPLFEHTFPEPGSEPWMRWFQNPHCGDRFDKRCLSTDFSLQMSISLQNFRFWRNEGSNILSSRYKAKNSPARILEVRPLRLNSKATHDDEDTEEVEIRRNYPRPDSP
jgi:hypothetical protein